MKETKNQKILANFTENSLATVSQALAKKEQKLTEKSGDVEKDFEKQLEVQKELERVRKRKSNYKDATNY